MASNDPAEISALISSINDANLRNEAPREEWINLVHDYFTSEANYSDSESENGETRSDLTEESEAEEQQWTEVRVEDEVQQTIIDARENEIDKSRLSLIRGTSMENVNNLYVLASLRRRGLALVASQ